MRELEMRVATILFRVGFVKTFRQAHYLIKERCIYVNGERVNLPRQRLHVGDVLHVRTKHKANGCNLPRGEFHITEPLPYRTHRSYSLPNQTPSGFSSPFPSCHGHFWTSMLFVPVINTFLFLLSSHCPNRPTLVCSSVLRLVTTRPCNRSLSSFEFVRNSWSIQVIPSLSFKWTFGHWSSPLLPFAPMRRTHVHCRCRTDELGSFWRLCSCFVATADLVSVARHSCCSWSLLSSSILSSACCFFSPLPLDGRWIGYWPTAWYSPMTVRSDPCLLLIKSVFLLNCRSVHWSGIKWNFSCRWQPMYAFMKKSVPLGATLQQVRQSEVPFPNNLINVSLVCFSLTEFQ